MNTKIPINIVSSPNLWMEGTAINQVHHLINLSFVTEIAAMPDLHAGKTPVGVALVTCNQIYPHIIGTDIGCGMSLFDSGLDNKRMRVERWESLLNTIKTLGAVPNKNYFFDCPIPNFGTIGSGNHFAEFQLIDKVYSQDYFNMLKLSTETLYLTVHSGSRSFGSTILKTFPSYDGYDLKSKEATDYIELHNSALYWASLNRDEVAIKLINYLGFKATPNKVIECNHNFLEVDGETVYHRKGVVSAKNGAVLIAGSRGTLSYIVMPTLKCSEYAYSLSHGAGRKWARSMCKARIDSKYTQKTIKQNKYNGRLVCHDLKLIYEEAPDVYKNIDAVIDTLLDFGLIEVVATLKPMLTFKG